MTDTEQQQTDAYYREAHWQMTQEAARLKEHVGRLEDARQTDTEAVHRLAEAARHPHKGPDDTDASMLREAAKRAATGYVVGGSNTSATVAKVLRACADLIDEASA